MTQSPIGGHDGPYPAPVVVAGRVVAPEWIDFNGHMNVGYYGIAFDQAADILFEDHLGLGEAHVAQAGQGSFVLQEQTHFLNELREGEGFSVRFRVVDHDSKRLHVFAEMIRDGDDAICATQEVISMNVDHTTRRSAVYPDWALRRLARMKSDHAGLDRPPQLGAPLGLRQPR
ncbi:MAG: thioesterase family protein [Antarcticimicrobium sp.]|uniref:thioesterase family protein n=1 Tax=Antarcticimicrobium sp. TaxID=2824147 RepID=UPI0026198760|nr:thioesterase family protein [Antarcticimicrobium sp.]MDF1718982.1 thioesterase family protein [Antarcticimicrobium sp.]